MKLKPDDGPNMNEICQATVDEPVPAGAESQLARAVEEYRSLLREGRTPDRSTFLARFPKLTAALADCLDALDFIHVAGSQLKDSAPNRLSETGHATPGFPSAVPLGDYRILRKIGQGGMGVVYEAEQLSLGRRVALKVLPFASALDPKQLQRFKNEAQAAAHLHHVNIVPIFAVGSERGVHYYAMQFIEGQSLAELIADLRKRSEDKSIKDLVATGSHRDDAITLPQATAEASTKVAAALTTDHSTKTPTFFRTVANLGLQAAEALEHAHQMGILHRDIKPANLMVDPRGNLWVTDFGLARFQSDANLTMTGDLLGTIRYMSPEQALAKRIPIDHRTDVYSLGVTLYELLTLQPAFDGRDRQELLRQIAFEEPRRPRQLNKAIPAELEIIVLKAMGKNPEERFATAQEVADDLRRLLEDKPIRAKRPTPLQVARKWALRHRTLVRATLLVVLMAAACLAGSTLFFLNTKANTANEIAAVEKAKALAEEEANKKLEVSLYYQTIALAMRERSAGNVGFAEQLLDACPVHLRGWEWHYLKRLRYGNPLSLPHDAWVRGLAASPNGRIIASGDDRGTIKIWDVGLGTEIHRYAAHGGPIIYLAYSPKERLLASASWDGTIRVWETATWKQLHEFRTANSDAFEMAAFSPDGRRLASYDSAAKAVKVWDTQTGAVDLTVPRYGRVVLDVAFSPDGNRLVSAESDKTVKVWDSKTGKEIFSFPTNMNKVQGIAFALDGRQLALAGGDWFYDGNAGEVKIWDVETGDLIHDLRGHIGAVFGLAFSPDGQRLATAGGEDHTVRLWDLVTGKEALTLRGHAEGVWRVAFSTDGLRLYSGGVDRTLRIWDATPLEETPPSGVRVVRGHSGRINGLTFSPDGKVLGSAGMDRQVLLWDVVTGQKIRALLGHKYPVQGLAFNPKSGLLVSVNQAPDLERRPDFDGEVKVWDVTLGKELPPLPGASQWGGLGVAVSPDGRWLALPSLICEAGTGDLLSSLPSHAIEGLITSVAFRADSRQLAMAGVDGRVAIWDFPATPDGRMLTAILPQPSVLPAVVQNYLAFSRSPLRVFEAEIGRLFCLTYSPDGKLLATAGVDGLVKLWDTKSWELVRVLRGHQGSVQSIAFGPDGKTLVSGGDDAVVRVWGVKDGQEKHAFFGHTNTIYSVAISPDGQYVASAGSDGDIRLWETQKVHLVIVDARPFLERLLSPELPSQVNDFLKSQGKASPERPLFPSSRKRRTGDRP